MKIEVGLEHLAEVKVINFKKYAKKVAAIDKMIKEKTGAGSDFLGWYDYPTTVKDELIDDIQKQANKYREEYECLVVCGIGGSYLGSKAAIEAINGLHPLGGMEILYLGNTLDPNYCHQLLTYLENKKFCVCCISKSGTTTETSVSFRLLKNILKKQYGANFAKAIVAVTDATSGDLRKEAEAEGYLTYDLPGNIGGRYSVMTAVGLFPIACAGIDIKALMNGMKEAKVDLDNDDVLANPAYQYAVCRNYMFKQSFACELLVSYEPQFVSLNEWWKQLFGESEGKDGKAVFPTSATFTTDLHSLGQFIQEGSKILYETVLNIKNPNVDVIVPEDQENLDGLNYLAGKSLSYINNKAYIGTLKAHSENGGVPIITLSLEKMDPENLGYLFYFFMKSSAMSAYLLEVNPFNQPGVEIYKKNMFHLLGKKGY